MTKKYLLIEEDRAIVCDTEDQLRDATRRLLVGAPEGEIEGGLSRLAESGMLEFEGDPALRWEAVELVPFDQFVAAFAD